MPRIIHFEIPCSNPARANEFYKKAFGWKIKQWGKEQYWMVTTGKDPEPGINGAIMPKKDLKTTVNTLGVASVDKALKKILAAGGKVVRPKIAIRRRTKPGARAFPPDGPSPRAILPR